MNKICLSVEAQNDLMEIRAYIEEELLNPSAALNVVGRITKAFIFYRIMRRPEHCYLRLQMWKVIIVLLYAGIISVFIEFVAVRFILTVFFMLGVTICGFCLVTLRKMNNCYVLSGSKGLTEINLVYFPEFDIIKAKHQSVGAVCPFTRKRASRLHH